MQALDRLFVPGDALPAETSKCLKMRPYLDDMVSLQTRTRNKYGIRYGRQSQMGMSVRN